MLTILGGGVVLAGFFGINLAERDEGGGEESARKAWERQSAALQAELEGHQEAGEEMGGRAVGVLPPPPPPGGRYAVVGQGASLPP